MPATTINGLTHFYEDEGSGDPLVMIHGASGSAKSFRPQIPALVAAGFRVIAPDLRAMSRSAHVDQMPPSAWNDDLEALLTQLGIASAHMYGVSLGARVVARHAVDYPARVRTLIMDATIIANDSAGNASLNNRFRGEMSQEQIDQYQDWHGDDWRDVIANFTKIRNVPELQGHYNFRESATQISAPTLITRGDRDEPVHPLAHSIEFHRLIPNSTLWIRPECDSGVLRNHPDEYIALLRRFVDTHQPAGVA